jgi:4,4'-diaponeurosporenoate glycosyltransferase
VPSSLVWFVLGWVCGWLLLARRPSLPPVAASRPAVAVVVPARDEAASLPHLLATVVPQLRPGDELVVVDDHSADATAALAADAGATVLAAPELPAGWAGKCWAVSCGVAATTAPVLVLVDADVRLGADALDRLVPLAVAEGGLVSVQPWHRTRRPYEQASLVCNLVGPMGSGAFEAWGRPGRSAMAFGPVLVTTRTAYDAVGGHAHPAVRDRVAEDLALARRFGGATVLLDRRLAEFRMYPGGFGQLLEGWTKNLAAGASAVPSWRFVLVAAWLTSLAGGWLTHPVAYGASALQLVVLGRRVGRFGVLSALVHPVWTAVFLVVFVRSTVRRVTGRPVRWRGRSLRA